MNLTISKILATFLMTIIVFVNLFGKMIGVGDIIPTHPVTEETVVTEPVFSKDDKPVFAKDGKRIVFGSEEKEIISAFGKSDDLITENTVTGSVIRSYVYASESAGLTVIQAIDGVIAGVYTLDDTAVFADEKNNMNISTSETLISGLHTIRYEDKLGSYDKFAVCVRYGKSDYSVSDLTSFSGQEKLMFYVTNGYRAKSGIKALSWSDKAASAAKMHSEDMALRNYCEHTSPDGVSAVDRIKAQGIISTIYAENISAGAKDAFEAVHIWFNSENHRENMLDSRLRYLGTGAAYNSESDYKTYFTQNFYR